MKYAFYLCLTLAALARGATLDFKEMSKEINAPADALEVNCEFEFTNHSQQTLTIAKADAGCSCVAVQLSDGKLSYKPGESGTVKAKFDMTNFSGTVDKAIALFYTGDPADKPSQVLKLKVIIPVLVGIEPKTLKWDLGGDAQPQTIRIQMIQGQTIHVTSVNSSNEGFACELKTVKDGELYEVIVTPREIATPKIGIFRIDTDCKIKKHSVQQAFGVIRKPMANDVAPKP